MKQKTEQLENRGQIAVGIEYNYLDTTFEQRIAFLKSNLPADRTLGARLLAKNSGLSAIDCLIDALLVEKKLYTKIEICNTLVSFGEDAVLPLIGLLGKIGSNQHIEVPAVRFKKNNYPLPRDIAARTLIRIGVIALPELLKVLESNDFINLSEAIDAIGFICFYNYQDKIFGLLEACFYRNKTNDLIKWKIFRAMGAFPESESFLKKQQTQLNNAVFYIEIERSLSLIGKREIPKRDIICNN